MTRKILLATPLAGQFSASYARELVIVLTHQFPNVVFAYHIEETSPISWARNVIANLVMNGPYDEVVMLDKDLRFNAAHFERLLSHDVPIVCGTYSTRTLETFWIGKPAVGAAIDSRGLVKVDCCALGFSKITKKALIQIAEKFPTRKGWYGNMDTESELIQDFFPMGLFKGDEEHPSFRGEDFPFCAQATEAGVDVLLDTRLVLRHDATIPVPISTNVLLQLVREPWRLKIPQKK